MEKIFTHLQSFDLDFLPRKLHSSPDGSCLIASSYSTNIDIINFSDINISLALNFPTTVTCCCWYPLMTSSDPSSCCFASVCPFNPIQLVDSLTGRVRSSYRCQYHGDLPASLTSVCFNGASLLAGGTRTLYEVEISRSSSIGQPVVQCPGSIMSIAPHPSSALIALGISTGDIVLIDGRNYEILLSQRFHQHAVDLLTWHGETVLFASARTEDEIIAFDARTATSKSSSFGNSNFCTPSFIVETSRSSSRPISLEISEENGLLFAGNEKGEARVFDLKDDAKLVATIGDGETPLVAPNASNKRGQRNLEGGGEKLMIAAASGKHVIIEDEEEDDSGFDVVYEPKLKEFGFYLMEERVCENESV